MLNLFFFIRFTFLITLYVHLTEQKLVLKLNKNKYNLYSISLCLGQPLVCNEMAVSLIENYITVYKNFFYNPNKSSSSKFVIKASPYSMVSDKAEIHYGGHKTLQLGDNTLIKIHSHNNHVKRGFFGLGYYSINRINRPCLLAHLAKISRNKKVFYLNTKDNTLIIGSYPKGYEQYKPPLNPKVKYCHLEQKNMKEDMHVR